jgi:hypothetical protein
MQFTLLGFTQETVFRVFSFECMANDKTKTAHTIRVDLALSRKHGIPLQELPLLCRSALEQDLKAEQTDLMTFTESEMLLHARTCAEARAAALLKRKTPRRPAPSSVDTGNGWRGSMVSKVAESQSSPTQFLAALGSS